jgi:hypothetical protein
MGVGVAAIIITMAVSMFSKASDQMKATDVIQQVLAIHEVVQALYPGTDMSDMTTEVIARSRMLPNKYITGGGTGLTNAFRGATYVYSIPFGTAFFWDVLFEGLSPRACVQVALSGLGFGETTLIQMVVNPNPGIPSAGGVGSFGLSPAAWRDLVNANCTRSQNTVRFSFGRVYQP